MALTTGICSVTVVVDDTDRALAHYRDVLGCEVRTDVEVWPGGRLVEVVPPGSDVPVALLTREGGLPLGVRYWTDDADATHAALVAAGSPPDTEVLHLDGAPPMFTVKDPEGNTVIIIQGPPSAGSAPSGGGFRRVLAQATVRDLDAAEPWYTTLFGGPPDARPMDGLLEWHLGDGFGVQVFQEPDRAGHSCVVLDTADLDALVDRLTAAGVTHDGPQPVTVGRVLVLSDPDGNRVVASGA